MPYPDEQPNKAGGRGKCRYCEQWENNVSYHEAQECPKRHPIPQSIEPSKVKKEVCGVCKWSNTNLLNIGEFGTPVWVCHGCIKRKFDAQTGIVIHCDSCKEQITKPAGLLFSPPFGSVVHKYHLCHNCYALAQDVLSLPSLVEINLPK